VQLEDPQQVATSSSTKVAILGSIERTLAESPKWEKRKLIEERNNKFRDDIFHGWPAIQLHIRLNSWFPLTWK